MISKEASHPLTNEWNASIDLVPESRTSPRQSYEAGQPMPLVTSKQLAGKKLV